MRGLETTASLEAIARFRNLYAAAHAARRGKHLSRASAGFFVDLETELLALERALLGETWRPGGFRSFVVTDPKPRLISAAPFGDRVVHHAVCGALGARLDAVASEASCACRVGRGTAAAIARARGRVGGGGWFVKLDVRRYFETIDHEVLLAELGAHVGDAGFGRLVGRIVRAGAPGAAAGKGVPIGNLTSQHFANFYLSGFDHGVAAAFPEVGYVRYMDDLVFVAESAEVGRRVEAWARGALAGRRLEVKESATRRGPVGAGVPFLGLRLWPGAVRLDRYRRRRLGRRVAAVAREARRGGEERAGARYASLAGWAALGGAEGLLRAVVARQRGGGVR